MPNEPLAESEARGVTMLEAAPLAVGEVSQLHKLATVWVADNVPTQEFRRVLELATEVFEDPEKAMLWLQQRNIQTGDRPPVSTLGKPSGLQNVETVLRQIQYGVIG